MAELGMSYRVLRLSMNVIWVVAVLLGVILVVAAVATALGTMHVTTSIPVAIELDESRFVIESADPSSEVKLDSIEGELNVSIANASIALWAFVFAIYGLALWLLTLVRDVVRSLEASPFTRKNAQRVTIVGWIVLACVLAVPFLPAIIHTPVDEIVRADGLTLAAIDYVSLNLGGILIACIILVIGQVFRYGTRLEQDARFTV